MHHGTNDTKTTKSLDQGFTEANVSGEPRAPDGGWGWAIVFASFMIHVIADGIAYSFGIFFVAITKEFHESKSETSWVASIMSGVTYGAGPLAAAFVNRWGCRPVSILGSTLASIGFGASYFADGIIFLYVSLGLVGGFGLGLIYLPSIVSVTSYFEKKRAFATGVAVCGSGIGTFACARLIAFLIHTYGWRITFLFASGGLFTCVFFSLLLKPLPASPASPQEVKLLESSESPITISKSPTANYPTSPIVKLPASISPQTIVKPKDSIDPLLPKTPNPSTSREPEKYTKPEPGILHSSNSHPVLAAIDRDYPPPSDRRYSVNSSVQKNTRHSSTGIITSRNDIFFAGSLTSLPKEADCSSRMSLNDISQHTQRRCCPKLHNFFYPMKEMMDFSLLKEPVFILFGISNFLTSFGYNIPYVYIVDMALQGNDSDSSEWLISIIGISNTISRVALGYISDKPWVNRLVLYNVALAISGVGTGLISHTVDIGWLRAYAVTFGITIGVYVSLTSVILVDLLGLQKLTSAFGLILLFQGIATLIGPPIVGKLVDVMKEYPGGFWLAGSAMAVGGIILFFVPLLRLSQRKDSTRTAP